MRRRDFLALAGALTTRPRVAFAQQGGKVPRIAFLSVPEPAQYDEGFKQGLADNGYVIGKSITLDYFTTPTLGDLPALAAMAVASKPDILAVSGAQASLAAKAATTTIPIVFMNVSDPVAIRLVDGLAKPGRNITGNTLLNPDLAGKQVEIMTEILPNLKRLAILNVRDDSATPIVPQVRAVAAALKIEPVNVDLLSTKDLAPQLDGVIAANAQAVYVTASAYLGGNAVNRGILVDFLLKNRLPAVASGITPGANPITIGLVGYGPNVPDLFRQAAGYVDAILKGAKPGDLPVQEPRAFLFVINLTAAKAMGLTIPNDILARADQVIQ